MNCDRSPHVVVTEHIAYIINLFAICWWDLSRFSRRSRYFLLHVYQLYFTHLFCHTQRSWPMSL